MFLNIVAWIIFVPTAFLAPFGFWAVLTGEKPIWSKILVIWALFIASGYHLFH